MNPLHPTFLEDTSSGGKNDEKHEYPQNWDLDRIRSIFFDIGVLMV
jgi:hypothetical protein